MFKLNQTKSCSLQTCTRSVPKLMSFHLRVNIFLKLHWHVRMITEVYVRMQFHWSSYCVHYFITYTLHRTQNHWKTRCVMKHKCPRTRQIPEVAIIVKTQGQDFKIYDSNIKVLSQVTCICNIKALSLTI